MGPTADQLRQELEQKRINLTHDVDRIEQKVRSTFDLNRQVEENPLLATGLAVVGGFLLGSLVGGRRRNDTRRHSSSDLPGSQEAPDRSAHESRPSGGPGIIAGIRRGSGSRVDDTMSTITAALTAVLVDKAKELLDENVPGFADKYEQARRQSRGAGYSAGAMIQSTGVSNDASDNTMGTTSTGSSGGGTSGEYGSPSSPSTARPTVHISRQ